MRHGCGGRARWERFQGKACRRAEKKGCRERTVRGYQGEQKRVQVLQYLKREAAVSERVERKRDRQKDAKGER